MDAGILNGLPQAVILSEVVVREADGYAVEGSSIDLGKQG